ncbi:DNA-binding response regulator [Methylocystaceae bacterium]|jgi:DNA-binding NarL/FixJ family response regulator|nr:DNA-binding response regulator [Methylocystaceae bacterium]
MKILIVDDHPVIIAGCRSMFAAEENYEIIDAKDADSGFEAFVNYKPDLCIIDISLPGKPGFDLVQRIIERNRDAKIIIFSMNDDPVFASRALRLGAKGYVTKNDNPYLLLDAINAVMSGKNYLMTKISEALSIQNDVKNYDIWTILTEREREVFKLLGTGMKIREIAQETGISYKTVANTCSIIKNKLKLQTIGELSQMALEYKDII